VRRQPVRQRLSLVLRRHAVLREPCRRRLDVVGEELQPEPGLRVAVDLVQPQRDRPERDRDRAGWP